MRSWSFFSFLLALCLLGGCAHPPPPSAFDLPLNAPYTLGSGDRLRILVFGQDSLSNSYTVDNSGFVSMPLIGPVYAKGLTLGALELSLRDHLMKGYIREPRVSVEIEAYRPFFILGEVAAPGQYPYVSGITVQTAVAIAGGFSPRAVKSYADMTRLVEGVSVTHSVPMTQPVRAGDTLLIKERFF